MSKTTEQYLLMVTSQYQNSPKFLEWLKIVIEMCEDKQNCADQMVMDFDIDSALGNQLDVLGTIIGQSRFLQFDPTETSSHLSDEDYRKVLKLRTYTNYWDGKLQSLYSAWNKVFTDCTILVDDKQNMSAEISLSGRLSSVIKEMIYNDLIIPRPEGVEYFHVGVAPETSALFTYDYNDTESEVYKGYDVGYWDVTF